MKPEPSSPSKNDSVVGRGKHWQKNHKNRLKKKLGKLREADRPVHLSNPVCSTCTELLNEISRLKEIINDLQFESRVLKNTVRHANDRYNSLVQDHANATLRFARWRGLPPKSNAPRKDPAKSSEPAVRRLRDLARKGDSGASTRLRQLSRAEQDRPNLISFAHDLPLQFVDSVAVPSPDPQQTDSSSPGVPPEGVFSRYLGKIIKPLQLPSQH